MFFLNPFAMVVGGALVSAPILIHLINRMRFRRVRWAAMEFLLKSQKRNRRRLIIEQLILLALRCLLILLAGFLLARFVGQALGMTASSSTLHVVVLDDSLSMRDRAPKPPGPDCFAVARQQIDDITTAAAKSESAQKIVVFRMSDPREPFFKDRLDENTGADLSKKLKELQATAAHYDPAEALEAVKKELGESRDSKRWVHVVSDFRDQDWGRKPGTEKTHAAVQEIAETGASVVLVDTGSPSRQSSQGRTVDPHNNYFISELRPDKRVAPAGTSVPFTVEIENFGTDSRESVFLEVYQDGVQMFEVSRFYDAPPPGGKKKHTFELIFEAPKAEGDAEAPPATHRVTVRAMAGQGVPLDPAAGLSEDNVRHTLVEVRKYVPTLVIAGGFDPKVTMSPPPGSDARVIKDALESVKGTEAVKVVLKGVDELLRPDLASEYAAIYLLNVENLNFSSPKGKDEGKGKDKEKDKPVTALDGLRAFVAGGGNVVFFTGPAISLEYYTKVLFEQEKGLFPVPLGKDVSTTRAPKEEIEKRRNSNAPKIFVLDPEHEMTRGIAGVQYKIPDLIIPQYTPVKDRFEWARPWAKAGDVKELITLANLAKVDAPSRRYLQKNMLDKLPLTDKQYEKFHKRLKYHYDQIFSVAASAGEDEMFKVAEAIENMLNDKGEKPGEKGNVGLAEFWALPATKDLRDDFLNYRKDMLYGSPLAVTRKYGKGNVVAVLTTAGVSWSGWAGGPEGGVASFTFPMVIADLQKFLTRGGGEGTRLVGEKLVLSLDPAQYTDKIDHFVQRDETQAKEGEGENAPPGFKAVSEKPMRLKDGKLVLEVEVKDQAGVHLFRAQTQKGATEESWSAFNVDTSAESYLRRATADDLVRNPIDPVAGRVDVRLQNDSTIAQLREKRSDFSESPWLYLIFLVVLIAEQALAVHLSHHNRNTQAAGTPAAGGTVAPASAAPAAVPVPAGV